MYIDVCIEGMLLHEGRPWLDLRFIFLQMAFGKQVAFGHYHFQDRSPLLPIVFVQQSSVPSLQFPSYQKEQPNPEKQKQHFSHATVEIAKFQLKEKRVKWADESNKLKVSKVYFYRLSLHSGVHIIIARRLQRCTLLSQGCICHHP